MKIGSLCSGYGGLDMAVEEVLGGRLAWVADNDPDAAKVLAYRYPSVPNFGDITKVNWSEVEPVDVLCAGFPCTDISCAGQRAGLRAGNRSGLWFHVARVIEALRPPLVVIENVKELLSERADSDMESCPWCLGDLGPESAMRALGAVLADLASLGLDAEWVSVPAAGVGACHLRWRVFVLAWPAADAARLGAGEPADEADAFSGGRGARPVPGGGGAGPAADAGSARRREVAGGAPGDEVTDAGGGQVHDYEPGCHRSDAPADTERGRRERRPQEPQRGPEWGTAAWWHRPGAFGRYDAAVRRHERVFGRLVPAPVAPNAAGEPRLAPEFNEWMMGLPRGWVTDVPGLSRNAMLKILGNGVVPQQGALALRLLLERSGLAEGRDAA